MRPTPLRDKLFQWITERYPTERIQSVRSTRNWYRVLLHLIRPRGAIHLRTPHYGIWFRRDETDLAYYIALKRAWEPFETRVLRERLQQGMHVVDIGANVGHYAIIAAQAVGASGRVYAFEPTPNIFTALQANLALNGLDNAVPFALACSDRDGALELFLDADNAGGHSVGQANVATVQGSLRVEAVRLDSWVEAQRPSQRIALIKMDTQGSEAAVLRGAPRLLRDDRPVLILEFWPAGLRNAGASAEEVLQTLGALGYRLQVIDERSRALHSATPERLLADYPADRPEAFTNLLATPPA